MAALTALDYACFTCRRNSTASALTTNSLCGVLTILYYGALVLMVRTRLDLDPSDLFRIFRIRAHVWKWSAVRGGGGGCVEVECWAWGGGVLFQIKGWRIEPGLRASLTDV